jgi:hypothetical protein
MRRKDSRHQLKWGLPVPDSPMLELGQAH